MTIENTAAVTKLAHVGTSHTELCNNLAHRVCDRYIVFNICLRTAHIPGTMSVFADRELNGL